MPGKNTQWAEAVAVIVAIVVMACIGLVCVKGETVVEIIKAVRG